MQKENKTSKRGGYREGAGAKIKTCDGKAATKQMRLSEGEANFIKEARKLKLNLHTILTKI